MKTSKNKYYHECPQCHCALDPGERCEDCNPRERIPYPDAKGYKSVDYYKGKEEKKNAHVQTN